MGHINQHYCIERECKCGTDSAQTLLFTRSPEAATYTTQTQRDWKTLQLQIIQGTVGKKHETKHRQTTSTQAKTQADNIDTTAQYKSEQDR